jgi:hypothetical protein
VIEKMQVYDDKKILAELYQLSSKQKLANEKKYLYLQLLKVLSHYLMRNKPALYIEANMMYYEVLLKKNLLGQAMEILIKTKKICYYTERLNYLPELILRQLYITRLTGKHSELYPGLRNEFSRVLTDLKIEFELSDIIYRIESEKDTREVVVKKYIDGMQALLPEIHSGIIKRLYYENISRCYEITGDYDNAIINTGNWMRELEEHPDGFDENRLKQYIICASQLINYCYLLQRYEEGLHVIGKISNCVPEGERMVFLKEKAYLLHEMSFLLKLNKQAELLQNIDRNKRIFKKIFKNLKKNERCIIQMNFMIFFYSVKQVKDSLNYLNDILNDSYIKKMKTEYLFCLCMEILIQNHLGNHDLIENKLVSLSRASGNIGDAVKGSGEVITIIRKLYRQNQKELDHRFWNSIAVNKNSKLVSYFDFLMYQSE